MAYDERKTAAEKKHSLSLENRKSLRLSGVERVDSFDETEAVVITAGGELCVRGEGLYMESLDLESGSATVTGKVSALIYSEPEKHSGLWARIFH